MRSALHASVLLMSVALLILSYAVAHAGYEACSASIAQSPKMARAVDFLRSVSGSYQLGDCQVELHVCTRYAADDTHGSIVGDLLLVDKFGHESYIELDFIRQQTDKTSIDLQNGRIMLHYEFDDRNADPEFGRTESIRLELIKSPDKKSLMRIESGVYSTRAWIERGKKFTYYWSICEGRHDLDLSNATGVVP